MNVLDRRVPLDLQINVVVDNLSVHKGEQGQRWLRGHPMFYVPFVSARSSWRSMLERWLGQLRRMRWPEIASTVSRSSWRPARNTRGSRTARPTRGCEPRPRRGSSTKREKSVNSSVGVARANSPQLNNIASVSNTPLGVHSGGVRLSGLDK